ncbi:hypothetical protein JR316_0007245 [Psilocybe cubensis]|uniref:Uncharacterized protein n=1 Tax=Psilocybe cubensis TaxID=181762 RepID=A0ACB8GYT4_PSICU|nr:hypothetical protein JR316_0007245 [Psilocybe cubensis]KAH9480645.1 hypothetical protein JR316_0007245 [Psilocybe cubensis]
MPVVEFVWWNGTEEFLGNLDALFKPTINHVSKADGCLRRSMPQIETILFGGSFLAFKKTKAFFG